MVAIACSLRKVWPLLSIDTCGLRVESLSGRFSEVFSSRIFCLSLHLCLYLDLHFSSLYLQTVLYLTPWLKRCITAQNVRSGSSPGPTNDPDLWSRPPIQTFPRELIQTFDPDLWNDIIYGRVDVCSSSPCQAAKQQTVLKPRCQAVKLLSCTCSKATLLSSQAVKQPSCTCC